jgi:xanthine/CO dehydrogenase XdhC/CoxF family maturation factor
MRERRQIVQRWQEGSATVLVTLVRAEGSSYRQPGARLLLGADGAYAGTISGAASRRKWCARQDGWCATER